MRFIPNFGIILRWRNGLLLVVYTWNIIGNSNFWPVRWKNVRGDDESQEQNSVLPTTSRICSYNSLNHHVYFVGDATGSLTSTTIMRLSPYSKRDTAATEVCRVPGRVLTMDCDEQGRVFIVSSPAPVLRSRVLRVHALDGELLSHWPLETCATLEVLQLLVYQDLVHVLRGSSQAGHMSRPKTEIYLAVYPYTLRRESRLTFGTFPLVVLSQ